MKGCVILLTLPVLLQGCPAGKGPSFSSRQPSSSFLGPVMCKNLIMGPAKLIEVSLEGYFKDSITRKRWLGSKNLFSETKKRLRTRRRRRRSATGRLPPPHFSRPRILLFFCNQPCKHVRQRVWPLVRAGGVLLVEVVHGVANLRDNKDFA